jgi:ketosteroid isomerase-like protein
MLMVHLRVGSRDSIAAMPPWPPPPDEILREVSEENVEAVRAVFERWSEGDFRASVELLDPHVVLVLGAEFPDAGTYVGAEAVAAYTRGLLEPWTHFAIDAEEIVGVGDSVLVAVRQSGVGSGSRVSTEFRYFMLWSFRGPKVIRIESFRERAEAAEAAGLRE